MSENSLFTTIREILIKRGKSLLYIYNRASQCWWALWWLGKNSHHSSLFTNNFEYFYATLKMNSPIKLGKSSHHSSLKMFYAILPRTQLMNALLGNFLYVIVLFVYLIFNELSSYCSYFVIETAVAHACHLDAL